MVKQTALVLEGGAMRGIYTAGALDIFLEQGLIFPYVIGVSAGALNGLSYISGQKGRNAKVTLEYANDPRYLGVRGLVRDRSIFNFEFMFGELAHDLVPFDWDAFEHSPQRFVAVASNCLNGRPAYFEKTKCSDIYKASAASGSMPLFSKMIEMDGVPYLDGGVAIPTGRSEALRQGYQKQVLILTRPKGYRKPPIRTAVKYLYARAFKKYPALLQKLLTVPERYNAEMSIIDRLEQEGQIFVIRPGQPVLISRMEKDLEKLENLYWEGRLETEAALPALRAYLEKP